MGGYKAQIRNSCRKQKKPFDYLDVLNAIPDGLYRPTERQVVWALVTADYLVIDQVGTKHQRTRYRMRKHVRRTRKP